MNTDPRIETIKNWLGTGSINLFGRPFAGKDTQAEILAGLLGAVKLSSGALFRSLTDNHELQAIMARGDLIPSDMFEELMLPYFSRTELYGRALILSSVGKAHGEEAPVMRVAEQSGHPLKCAIHLTMPESELWKRFDIVQQADDRGDRPDDNRDGIRIRLEEFDRKTLPVIDYYRARDMLIEVNGTASEPEVTESIIAALLSRAGATA